MRFWRLSSLRRARDFDGGYGLFNDGRWNTAGWPVTYCSTVASLAVLEKRVHATDPGLLPAQALVQYEIPDDIPVHSISIDDLPSEWMMRQTHSQRLGNEWLGKTAEAVLIVPSVIMAVRDATDRNALINHRHKGAAQVTISAITPFTFDPRLFRL